MRKTSLKKGFTLPEVLVSVSVIVMVVMAATNLLIASIRANAVNINTIVAYGLAQEGIEAVRNIRDSNWLLGADFRGQILRNMNTPPVFPWGVTFPGAGGQTAYYTVEFRDPLVDKVQYASELESVAPWKLEELASDDDYGGSSATALFKKAYGSAKELRYTHASQAAEATPFHRYLEITPVVYAVDAGSVVPVVTRAIGKVQKYRVASVVEWQEYGRRSVVRLDTELTDWKEQ